MVEVVDDVLDVVVVVVPVIGRMISASLQTPCDFTLMNVAASGTAKDTYPASNAAFETGGSNGFVYPSTFEYSKNGPVLVPAVVSVINIVCGMSLDFHSLCSGIPHRKPV